MLVAIEKKRYGNEEKQDARKYYEVKIDNQEITVFNVIRDNKIGLKRVIYHNNNVYSVPHINKKFLEQIKAERKRKAAKEGVSSIMDIATNISSKALRKAIKHFTESRARKSRLKITRQQISKIRNQTKLEYY